jgi:hypothetical protein
MPSIVCNRFRIPAAHRITICVLALGFFPPVLVAAGPPRTVVSAAPTDPSPVAGPLRTALQMRDWRLVTFLLRQATTKEDCQVAAAVFVNALRAKDATTRAWAARVIRLLNHQPGFVVQPLMVAVRDKDVEVRQAAAYSLGTDPVVALFALPALRVALNDPDLYVRAWSANAIGIAGRDARSLQRELLKRVRDESPLVRARAATAVWRINQDAPSAVKRLIPLLQSGNWTAEHTALYTLAEIGSAANAAIECPSAQSRDCQAR